MTSEPKFRAHGVNPAPLSTRNEIPVQDLRIIYAPLNMDVQCQAVSVKHTMNTGSISIFENPHETMRNQTIDLNADDAFANTVNRLIKNVEREVRLDKDIVNFYKKNPANLTRADRIALERSVTKHAHKILRSEPVFSKYSNVSEDECVRANHLNDLSSMIENPNDKTQTQYEIDCEVMGSVMGVLMQKGTDEILENYAQNGAYHADEIAGTWAQKANFYYAPNAVMFGKGDTPGLHLAVVSAATGNWIESTALLSQSDNAVPAYMQCLSGSFEYFLQGAAIKTLDGSTYGGQDSYHHDIAHQKTRTELTTISDAHVVKEHGNFRIEIQPMPSSRGGDIHYRVMKRMDIGSITDANDPQFFELTTGLIDPEHAQFSSIDIDYPLTGAHFNFVVDPADINNINVHITDMTTTAGKKSAIQNNADSMAPKPIDSAKKDAQQTYAPKSP